MTDKILSLASIKKCLEKVKDWAARKLNDCYRNKGDFSKPDMNDLVNLGFYRYHGGITNGPDALNSTIDDYGLISIISNKDYISQLVFSLKSRNNQTICHRTGTTETITDKPWLYFHGSTSPNIPVLKKKIITNITSDVNGCYVIPNFSPSNAIVLHAGSNLSYNSYVIRPHVFMSNNSNAWLIQFFSLIDNTIIKGRVGDVTIFYLEIPSDYEIPEDTTSSDEPEDDEGLAPQADFSNEESANYEE